jgi:hypothetical protein
MKIDGSQIIFALGVTGAVVTAAMVLFFCNSLKINHQENTTEHCQQQMNSKLHR